MASGPTPTPATSSGMQNNVAAALSYITIVGIVFLLIEPYNKIRFVRFHAFQSLLFHAALVVCWVGLTILGFILGAIHLGLIMIPIQLLVGLAVLGLHVLLMIKAYNNEQYELPTLGAMAKNWV